tara:strand:- start:604 stop:909 length:306 start_codon:yes stop_codon:yes gene_type:complete
MYTHYREVHDDDGNVVEEVEIEVEVDYTSPEDPSWDSPGDPGDVSICGAVLSGTFTKVELTDDEVQDIEKHFFDRLEDEQGAYEDHMYEMDRRNDVCDYPF